jgi:HK97 family phage major capsid protein
MGKSTNAMAKRRVDFSMRFFYLPESRFFMPYDNLPESEWEKMDQCVADVEASGKDKETAIRICYASLAGKSTLTAAPIYAPEIVEDVVAVYGDPVKAVQLPDGVKLGGYLVRFGDPEHTDLVGDYFTKNTDFGDLAASAVWLNHRMPVSTKRGSITHTQPLTNKASLAVDDIGVFAEVLLTARDEYEAQIAQAGLKGALSWSSGTASHLVDRRKIKSGVNEITRWPLGLDASLTPSPAEFRQENRITPIKSLPTPVLGENNEEKIMETKADYSISGTVSLEAVEAEVAKALAKRDELARAEATKAQELKAAEAKGYQAAIEELKSKTPAAFNRITEPGFSEEKDAVPAFKHWLQTGQLNEGLIRPDSVFENIPNAKAAWNIATGASGAFLVPDPLYNTIIAKRNLASWVRQAPVMKLETPAEHLLVPIETTSHTAFVQTAESIAYDENEGTVNQKDLILYKYTKLVKTNEEFLMYQGTNWEAWLSQALARAEAVTENTIFTNGTGSGEPEGIMTSATASAKLDYIDLAATIGKLGAGYNVPSECGFLMANASRWYLKSSVLAGPYAFTGTPTPVDFYGYPAYVSDDISAYTATSGKVLGFGNFGFYAIVEKPGMVVQRNPYLYMASGQIGIFASIFRGGGLLQTEAFYYTSGK